MQTKTKTSKSTIRQSIIYWGSALLAILFLSGSASATPIASRHGLPALSTFDKAKVQSLIDAVERVPNASILEYGYFMRRGTPPLPQSQGYALVSAALGKEPVASKRWFLLKSIQAFADFRVADLAPGDGYAAYDAILNHAADAKKVDGIQVVRKAIVAYVFLVPGRIVDMGLLSDPRTSVILQKSWKVYITLAPVGKPGLPDPPWAAAIQRAELQTTFLPIVDKTLQDPVILKSYGLLKTAAMVNLPTDPLKAIALLQQAGPLLPKDADEMRWYYSNLADWLTTAGKLKDAITVTSAGIHATGQGEGALAVLLSRTGDITGLQKSLRALSASDANEYELNSAAEGLSNLYLADRIKNKLTADQVVTLLSSYLNSTRHRDLEQDLHARVTLADILISQNRMAEAKVMISDVPTTPPPAMIDIHGYYYTLQQILAVLTARNI